MDYALRETTKDVHVRALVPIRLHNAATLPVMARMVSVKVEINGAVLVKAIVPLY